MMALENEASKIEVELLDMKSLSSKDEKDINHILDRSKDATIFHTLEWNKVLVNEFDLNENLLIARTGDRPAGMYIFRDIKKYGLINMTVSPGNDLDGVYGGPISIDGSADVIMELLKEAENVGRGMAFSILTSPRCDTQGFTKMGYDITPIYTPIIDLQRTEEEILKGFRRNIKRNIKKAAESNVIIAEGGLNEISDFYYMLGETLKSSGFNPLPEHFYESVLRDLSPKKMALLLLAKVDDKPIASCLHLMHKDTMYCWKLASNKEYRSYRSNDLIVWESIKWGIQNRYKYFDFVGINSDKLPGITQFKSGWGGEDIGFYHANKGTPTYHVLSSLYSLFKWRPPIASKGGKGTGE
jgi:hypothetical protein